jgi:MFS family permease
MASIPPENARHDPYGAFRFPAYRLYSMGYFVSVLGRGFVSAAVGYELYLRTQSATMLGMVGLAGALPVILFALPAGHLADRWNRKTILMRTQAISAVCSASLAWLSAWHARIPNWPMLRSASDAFAWIARALGEKHVAHFDLAVPLMLIVLFLNASARAFGWAARGAFVPNLVPRSLLANAITWNSSLFQIATTLGAMFAGIWMQYFGFPAAYLADVGCAVMFLALIGGIDYRPEHSAREHEPLREELLSGLRFVWKSKPIFGAITLDLFAVLIGGATALLPIYANEILHVGGVGFGWLRAAPSLGALIMGFMIAHLPPMRRAGNAMLWSVVGFGLATMVFGLSRNFVLSLVALALTGALDTISVVVRHTLVQALTPDSMRGRVSAINNVFINSSNEVGQLESGLTAAMFGPIASVVGGGVGVILVVLLVAWRLPEVRKIGALQDLHA